ncbi:MAG: hypothetical protein GX030_03040 [Firmicutes bacterium]|nr:hypothetical protein [Bacillota bacterium]
MLILFGLLLAGLMLFRRDSLEEALLREEDRALLLSLMGYAHDPKQPNY